MCQFIEKLKSVVIAALATLAYREVYLSGGVIPALLVIHPSTGAQKSDFNRSQQVDNHFHHSVIPYSAMWYGKWNIEQTTIKWVGAQE